MKQFDADKVLLQGTNLIEASAGTGKTYTLAELYCRLVVEKQLEVSQILVVTYTRAATEELRGRLRQRLVKERQDLSDQDGADPAALKRLKLAIQSFDEAAIFTIHGFCQRALQDFAFESGHFFDMEMVSDEEDIKQAVVDDFWRKKVNAVDPAFAEYLLQKKQTPETLLSAVGHLPGKPYLRYLPLPENDPHLARQRADSDFASLRQCWQNYNAEVIDIITDSTLLNGNKYRKSSVQKWLHELDHLLAESTTPVSIFKDLDRFTRPRLEDALKKGKVLPDHPFWDHAQRFLESHQNLTASRERQLQQLYKDLAAYLCEELPRRKLQSKVQAFDDLLLNLQQALHGEQGNKLAAQIRQQFQAALIDEFQDTDPVQYDCFNQIFSGSETPVFFVGDPKQAIYSFRGADIFTYLNAKAAAGEEFNLDTNRRSHPLLVEATNALFERRDNPFIYQAIPFQPVKAWRENKPALTVSGKAPMPLTFTWLDDDGDVINKGEMETLAASSTASQIALLIQQAGQGEVMLTEKDGAQRELNGGDVAVLVRSHSQASAVQQALRQRGINSVQQSRDNVFDAAEAVMLERVLMAVANPGNDSLIATALATPFFAFNALQIFELQQDDTQWLEQVDRFMMWHEQWRSAGFIVMLRAMLQSLNVQRRLLQQADGERQLTNLMHLAELVQAYASRRNSTIEAIMAWFAAQRQSAAATPDAAQIRLESDEQLVKVITIHTSKGLEYPVVFCPFLWHQGKPRQQPAVMTFHRPDDNQACAAFGEPGFSEAAPIAEQEQQAEDLRLLYVALTRARERCVILWGAAKESQKTALFSLLHADSDKPDAGQMYQDLKELAAQYPDSISLAHAADLPAPMPAQATDNKRELAARAFSARIDTPWQIGSFSGLSRGHSIERPDYDADTVSLDWPQHREASTDRFGFPRGANAGTCLHSLFEHWDFVDSGSHWQQLVHKTLSQFGIDTHWTAVVEHWLVDVVNTPLTATGNLSLSQIKPTQRLDEMAFYFPVSALTVSRLKKTLMPFAKDMPVLERIIPQLNFNDLSGFMKGFIDLVFEHKGRFYIADYKSNWLGDKASDYNNQSMTDAMVMHSYPLQYLLYSLALHRYLKTRLPDYDPDEHFGGVYYLFIRGMQPAWEQAGVYFDRPSSALLDALDRCMQESAHD